MKFDKPATFNPIDQLKVVGHPTDRIDGPLNSVQRSFVQCVKAAASDSISVRA